MSHLVDICCCPYCNRAFDKEFYCTACDISFLTNGACPDFRIDRPINITLDYQYTPEFGYFPWEILTLEWPSVDNGLIADEHWEYTEKSILKSVHRPTNPNELFALDIGCGHTRQRFKEGLDTLGYISVGMDIDGEAPDVLADAHSLPFKDETFDVIVSSAVFEHLKNPYAAMKELYRVAKPNARIILSIAYNEPFHISYFHHSPLAAHELLVANNLHPETIVVSAEWNAFNSNLLMGFAGKHMYSAFQKLLSKSILEFSLLSSRVKGFLKRDSSCIKRAELAFARSHSGTIGIVAHK